jgi:hypothetical protein
MPAKGQILEQLYRYSFSPELEFKNNTPLLLILLKLNIWVMELASASKEPWPICCPPSQPHRPAAWRETARTLGGGYFGKVTAMLRKNEIAIVPESADRRLLRNAVRRRF